MKPILTASLAGLAVLVGWVWVRGHDARLREGFASEQAAAVLAERRQVTDSLDALRAAADRQAEARVRGLEAIQRTQRRTMQTVTGRGDSLAALLASHLEADSLPDTVVVLIRSTLAAKDSGLAACRVGWAACDSTVGELEAIGRRRDSTLADLRGLLGSTDSLLAVERRRARPGLVEQVRRALPLMAASLIVGFLLR